MATLPWVSRVSSHFHLTTQQTLDSPSHSEEYNQQNLGMSGKSFSGGASMGNERGPEQAPLPTPKDEATQWHPFPVVGFQIARKSRQTSWDSFQSSHPCGASLDFLLSASKFAD